MRIKDVKAVLLLSVFLYAAPVIGQNNTKAVFNVVPLGIKGGIDESNLSAYMLAPAGTYNYICLDAGTLHYGIEKAVKNNVFKAGTEQVLTTYIKGYLISHAHLDHLAGLLINSPEDTPKNIYATPFVTDILKDKYFNWRSWANFANEGDQPRLNKYHYTVLDPSKGEYTLENTGMKVQAFILSHSNPYQSTAFLLRNGADYVLYLGDTGADSIEKSDRLKQLWQHIAPLVRAGTLKGIFIETSFSNEQPENQLFGHLTPKLLMKEMHELGNLTGQKAFKGFNIIITHIKAAGAKEEHIKKQLNGLNTLGLKLIFPQQGRPFSL